MTASLRTHSRTTICWASLLCFAQTLPTLRNDVPVVTIPEYQALFDKSKRWASSAQKTSLRLNLITAQTRVNAASLVTTGESVSPANPMSKSASVTH